MKPASVIRTIAISLLPLAAVAGCSGGAEESSAQADSTDDRQFGLETGESLYELTPAERRLQWVRRPASSQTAAVDARLAGESPPAKAR